MERLSSIFIIIVKLFSDRVVISNLRSLNLHSFIFRFLLNIFFITFFFVMFSQKVSILVACLCAFSSGAYGAVEVVQGGNYTLEYNLIDSETYSVTATVATLGWVGVGLSETADMVYSDLYIGGVENGEEYIGDYFAIRNTRPVEDIINNILTYNVTENATHTVMTFTRLSDTGDEYEDLPFHRAAYIIWAYSDTDGLAYHGDVNRGSIALSH